MLMLNGNVNQKQLDSPEAFVFWKTFSEENASWGKFQNKRRDVMIGCQFYSSAVFGTS